jgi:ribosome-associated toxin RatA of RatAB toxin-antitoxin module
MDVILPRAARRTRARLVENTDSMPRVEKSVLVAHSAATMFRLVDDVESYPIFLPWCGGSRVIERTDTLTVAAIDIRYAGVAQSFTTENTKQANEWMQLKLREGPFRSLTGSWHFVALAPEATKVSLLLDYQFANALLEAAVGPVFGKIADTMIDRFVARADALAASAGL